MRHGGSRGGPEGEFESKAHGSGRIERVVVCGAQKTACVCHVPNPLLAAVRPVRVSSGTVPRSFCGSCYLRPDRCCRVRVRPRGCGGACAVRTRRTAFRFARCGRATLYRRCVSGASSCRGGRSSGFQAVRSACAFSVLLAVSAGHGLLRVLAFPSLGFCGANVPVQPACDAGCRIPAAFLWGSPFLPSGRLWALCRPTPIS